MTEHKYIIQYSEELESWVGELWSMDEDSVCRVQRVADASPSDVLSRLELLAS